MHDVDAFGAAPVIRPRARAAWLAIALRIGLIALAAWALRRELRGLEPAALIAQLGSYGWRHVAVGLAATIASFVLLGVVERLALRYAGRGGAVPHGTAMTTAFVANAMSQSIGIALLTGAAVRMRAYHRHGLDAADVARVSTFVTLTATLGLLGTGSAALLGSAPSLQLWQVSVPVHAVGALLAAVVAAYLGWSMLGAGRTLGARRWRVTQPTLPLAVQQIALSALDWIVTGSILFVVLPVGLGVGFLTLLRTYLVAQTVGTLSHVPGGAGVFELVVLTLLAPDRTGAERTALVASLVMFRVLYYLLPLIVASVVAAIAELRASQTSRMEDAAHGR